MAAYTTIDDPSDFFSATLYTGDGSADQDITGAGFKPDFLWIKRRNAAERHVLTNAQMGVSNGAYKWLDSADTAANFSGGTGVASFDADGFTIKTSDTTWNASGSTYVFWSWKANGGTTSTNTTGNGIDTVVQANAAAGFSIITYTGNGTQSGQTVGHGLGAVPKMIISKDRTNSSNVVSWRVYHEAIGPTKYIELQSTAAESTFNDWDDTAPTSSVYSVGGAGGYTPTNTNNALYLAYVFAEVQGYSKFGSYVGNGNADGPFVYTGFKPAFLMMKESSSAGGNWVIFDNKRDVDNVLIHRLHPNTNAGDNTSRNYIDFYSNGFKMRNTDADHNQSGQTMIYMAVAENPFVTSTGIPTTAR